MVTPVRARDDDADTPRKTSGEPPAHGGRSPFSVTAGPQVGRRLLLAAALAGAAAAAVPGGRRGGAWAATGECANGAGQVCYMEYGCAEWGIRWIPVPPFLWPYCERYDVLDLRYWELDSAGSDGGESDEADTTAVQPEGG